MGGARCRFEMLTGVDDGGWSEVLEEDGESTPCTESIEDEEGACCGEGRISGMCCGTW